MLLLKQLLPTDVVSGKQRWNALTDSSLVQTILRILTHSNTFAEAHTALEERDQEEHPEPVDIEEVLCRGQGRMGEGEQIHTHPLALFCEVVRVTAVSKES